jgi:hypothetical protein
VERPTHQGDAWRLHVRPADEEGRVRQDILLAAVQQHLRLTAIRPLVPSLDDIYRVAVERPLPKRGIKGKGKRRRAAMAHEASTAASDESREPVELATPDVVSSDAIETTPPTEEGEA